MTPASASVAPASAPVAPASTPVVSAPTEEYIIKEEGKYCDKTDPARIDKGKDLDGLSKLDCKKACASETDCYEYAWAGLSNGNKYCVLSKKGC